MGPPGGRASIALDGEALRALDQMCADDTRNRPLQIKWLINQEVARREAAKS